MRVRARASNDEIKFSIFTLIYRGNVAILSLVALYTHLTANARARCTCVPLGRYVRTFMYVHKVAGMRETIGINEISIIGPRAEGNDVSGKSNGKFALRGRRGGERGMSREKEEISV